MRKRQRQHALSFSGSCVPATSRCQTLPKGEDADIDATCREVLRRHRLDVVFFEHVIEQIVKFTHDSIVSASLALLYPGKPYVSQNTFSLANVGIDVDVVRDRAIHDH